MRRKYIILYSSCVDALEENPDGINFYFGHELGHILRNHLFWSPFLAIPSFLPIIGAAYSRAREYTCDQFGAACIQNSENAVKALLVLVAGAKQWQKVDHSVYLKQIKTTSGFWMSLNEITNSYPWLVKRVAMVSGQSAHYMFPRRHWFAWAISPFLPHFGSGLAGSLIGLLMMLYFIAVFSVAAIPLLKEREVEDIDNFEQKIERIFYN